jgi:hypothetical protein
MLIKEETGEKEKILKRKGNRDEYRKGKERKDGARERKREEGNSGY